MSRLNSIALNFGDLDPLSSIQYPAEPEIAAAVLIAITDCADNPKIIFTRRADHLMSHAGQVSFPGGRWEPGDKTLIDTALRESKEEIGLQPELVDLQGGISSLLSKNQLRVQPFVGTVPKQVALTANTDEIAAIFYVPIGYFIDTKPVRMDYFNRSGFTAPVPAWDVDGHQIWGLTAMFTFNLLQRLQIHIDTAGLPERKIGH